MIQRAENMATRTHRRTVHNRFLLVADSNAGRLFHTAAVLERLQYSVWPVQSAAEALEMATTVLPSSIIITLHLEDRGSAELIKQIKRNNSTKSIAIFVLIDQKDPPEERACLAAGAVTCLSTPFQPEVLYRMIQVAIEPMPRMNIRVPTKLPVAVNNEMVECAEGDCASMLSEQGLFIRTLDPRPLNTRLSVTFKLGVAAISAEAIVVFCQKSGDDPGMGLQFLQIDPQDQMRIRKFIRETLT
jgi:CheY-like chemotaxis protein